MPRGPRGEKRPADVVRNAIKVAKIATGEDSEELPETKGKRSAGGLVGGPARASALSSDQRKRIAKKAAAARWKSQSGG